jgi:hypothetical protein
MEDWILLVQDSSQLRATVNTAMDGLHVMAENNLLNS